MANLEPKIGNLARFWAHLGDLSRILGAIFPKLAKTKKTTIVHHFGRFFWILGALLEAMLAHLSAMLEHVGAILEQHGDEMGAQERQDKPRSRPRPPR